MGILKRSGRSGPNDPGRKNPLAPPPEAALHRVLEEGSEASGPPRPSDSPSQRLLGLRVDIGAFRGLGARLSTLLSALDAAGAKASFFAPFGPDRTAKAAWPYLRDSAIIQKGRKLFKLSPLEWTDLLRGALLPPLPLDAPSIEALRALGSAGHEVGCLGWDARTWRCRMPGHRDADAFAVLDQTRGAEAYREALGREPGECAAPGFVCSEDSLEARESQELRYASDCRGSDPFLPVVGGRVFKTAQVPVTLPTAAELLFTECASCEECYRILSSRLEAEQWPVLRVSTDWEGAAFSRAFGSFLEGVRGSGRKVVPLGALLEARLALGPLPRCTLSYGAVEGMPGEVTFQMMEV